MAECAKCEDLQYEQTACTTTTNRKCQDCPKPASAKKYQCRSNGVAAVIECDAGFYLLDGACTGVYVGLLNNFRALL
jgi:hypothetical protein